MAVQSLESGCNRLDELLGGGLPFGTVAHIYGPSGAGKSTLALQFAVSAARRRFRVLYVDTDKAFSPLRLRLMAEDDFSDVARRILIASPSSFVEQNRLVSRLDLLCLRDVKLFVFDTIVSLYRRELGRSEENFRLNRLLNRQLGIIANLATKRSIIVLLINQVRGDDENPDGFTPVANSVVSFWSALTVRIKMAESKGYRDFKLFSRNSKEAKEFTLKLTSHGFE